MKEDAEKTEMFVLYNSILPFKINDETIIIKNSVHVLKADIKSDMIIDFFIVQI